MTLIVVNFPPSPSNGRSLPRRVKGWIADAVNHSHAGPDRDAQIPPPPRHTRLYEGFFAVRNRSGEIKRGGIERFI